MADVARVLNSHEGFTLDESFHVMVEYRKVPGGRCLDELPDFLTSTLVRKCDTCNRSFAGHSCSDANKERTGSGRLATRRSLCTIVHRCRQCSRTVSSAARQPDNPHRCGESFCENCSRFDLLSQHKCWMLLEKFSPEDKTKHGDVKFLYFDFETWVNQEQRLVPNLVVGDSPMID